MKTYLVTILVESELGKETMEDIIHQHLSEKLCEEQVCDTNELQVTHIQNVSLLPDRE